MEYSYAKFKRHLSEIMLDKSEYIDRDLFKSLDFSEEDLRNINKLKFRESLNLDLTKSLTNSSKFEYFVSKLESIAIDSSRFIITNGGNRKFRVNAKVTRKSKSKVKFSIKLSLDESGDEEYVNEVNRAHDSFQSERHHLASFAKSYLERKNLIYSLSNFFDCKSGEVEYKLDEYLVIEDVSKPFPYTFNSEELTKFCLVNMHNFKETKDFHLRETIEFDIHTSEESNLFAGHKNIHLLDTNKWRLSVSRQGQKFQRQFDDLNKAIDVRDKVLEFYDTHKRLPEYEEVGLSVKEFNDMHHISYHKDTELWKVSISKNGGRFNAYDTSLDKVLALRSKVEEFVSNNGRVPTYEEVDFIPISKRSSNHNLYYSKSLKSWTVTILRDGYKFKVYVDSLEEATEVRDKALEFYETNNRLPRPSEINFLNRRERNLNTKNISYNKCTKIYLLRIQRDNQKFEASSHSLHKSVQLREKVLKFYADNRRLPSYAEISH